MKSLYLLLLPLMASATANSAMSTTHLAAQSPVPCLFLSQRLHACYHDHSSYVPSFKLKSHPYDLSLQAIIWCQIFTLVIKFIAMALGFRKVPYVLTATIVTLLCTTTKNALAEYEKSLGVGA